MVTSSRCVLPFAFPAWAARAEVALLLFLMNAPRLPPRAFDHLYADAFPPLQISPPQPRPDAACYQEPHISYLPNCILNMHVARTRPARNNGAPGRYRCPEPEEPFAVTIPGFDPSYRLRGNIREKAADEAHDLRGHGWHWPAGA